MKITEHNFLNIAAYLFVAIDDCAALKAALLTQAHRAELKGTILVAPEGINAFVAGKEAHVREFLAWLKSDARFSGLEAKESWSDELPFAKMMVKVKPEIIRMDCPAIVPAAGRAPAVAAQTLKRWLDSGKDDAGREVVMLDTRNQFELSYGTFNGAIDLAIDKFTEFPAAVAQHKDALAGKTVVSFCTGGIRCEKAAIYMQNIGYENVYQIEGGILKYFEETGGAHYTGNCFVFDDREALTPNLEQAQGCGIQPGESKSKAHFQKL